MRNLIVKDHPTSSLCCLLSYSAKRNCCEVVAFMCMSQSMAKAMRAQPSVFKLSCWKMRAPNGVVLVDQPLLVALFIHMAAVLLAATKIV